MRGRLVGEYRIVREIAQGGMGVVFLAESTERDPGRRVALKLLHPRTDVREKEIGRFLREGRVGRTLRHRNILPIHELFRDGDHSVLVMEYVPGGPIANWPEAEDRPALLRAHLGVLTQIADALAYAHRHGIVHRDVKPGNVLVRRDGHPFLIDFGLARNVRVESSLTSTSVLMGTPGYMSPEQIRGPGHEADHRSDVWALGVSLYEVATGVLPFRSASYNELFDEILHAEPPSIRALAPHVSADLEAVILRAMEKWPAHRYQRAEDLRDDLQRVLAGERARAGRASLWVRRQGRSMRRNRLRVAAAAAGVLGLVCGSLYFSLHAAESERAVALEELDSARYQKQLQEGRVWLGDGDLERALLAFDRAETIAPADPRAPLERAEAYGQFEQYWNASVELGQARDRGYAPDDPEDARARYFDGLQAIVDGDRVAAVRGLCRAVDIDPGLYAAALPLYDLRGWLDDDERVRAALEALSENLKPRDTRSTLVDSFLAMIDGDPERAVRELERLSRAYPASRWIARHLGSALLAAYRDAPAARRDPSLLERAVEELDDALLFQPRDGTSWVEMGCALFFLTDERERERGYTDPVLWRRVREHAEKALRLDLGLAEAHWLLALISAHDRDWNSVDAHLERAADWPYIVDRLPALRAERYFLQGEEFLQAGGEQEAMRCFQTAHDHAPDRPDVTYRLAEHLWLAGDNEAALPLFHDVCQRLSGPRPAQASPPIWQGYYDDVELRIDACVGLFATAAATGRDAQARAARGAVEEELREGCRLSPETALNLAEALSTFARGDLQDCRAARELIIAYDLEQAFPATTAGHGILQAILEACPEGPD